MVTLDAMLNTGKVKLLREKLGLTMEAAATRAGFSGRQQWWLIESGKRSDVTMTTLGKLARALECKPKDLLK